MSNQIEKQITITFRWWNDSDNEIDPRHAEALEETATDTINDMIRDGFTSGELNDNIRMHDSDPEDGIEYQGWWEMSTATV